MTLPPSARRTITFDRGSEFLGYDHLARNPRMDAVDFIPKCLGAVREALSRLTSEGLLVAEPQRGFGVAPISQPSSRT